MAKEFSKNLDRLFSNNEQQQEEFIVPKGYRLTKEAKSERIQLLVRPNTKETLKDIAKAKGDSVNDLVNQILEDYIERESK